MSDKKEVFVKGVGLVEKELTKQERKMAAEWILAQSMLNELIGYEGTRKEWEELKDGYLDRRISWETWDKFFKKYKKIETLTEVLKGVLDKREQVKYIIKSQPMYYDSARNWWLWKHKQFKWMRVDETDIFNSISVLTELNTINSKEKTELIEALKQISRLNKPLDIEKTWVQFKDIIYDVKTGDRFKADPSFFVTNPIPYQTDPDNIQDTPKMDEIFTEWVGEENIQKLYEILAYCLLPDYPLHRIFCFIGAGLNGKSCFLSVIEKFVGSDNCSSTELDMLLSNPRFEITRLHKKLVCMMGETNFNEMSKTSMLKKLSGGDLIGFEYKNKDLMQDVNYAKMIIATNNLPTTTDKTIGFYRRWMIIDFPNQFSEQQDILSTIPEAEYEALALKCSFILKDLLEKRQFTNEGSVEERMEKYESKSNFLKSFVDEFIIEDLNAFITVNDFYIKFMAWSKTNRHREMFEKAVSIGLKKIGWEGERKYMDWLYDGKGGQARVWAGRKWKD